MQCFVALYVAGMCFASVTDEHDISIVGVVAVVAHPVQVFLHFSFVLELPLFDGILLTFEPVSGYFCSAIWTSVRIGQPS